VAKTVTTKQIPASDLKYGNCIDVLGFSAQILRIRPVDWCGLPAVELLLTYNHSLNLNTHYLRLFNDSLVSVETK
jgi:hypothetical protein